MMLTILRSVLCFILRDSPVLLQKNTSLLSVTLIKKVKNGINGAFYNRTVVVYRDQVAALQSQLGGGIEAVTVHKFQGREKDAIVLTSVGHAAKADDSRLCAEK